jgi:hypothetical protein
MTTEAKVGTAVGCFFGIVLLALATIGLAYTASNDRDKEAACMTAGGVLLSVSTWKGCFFVEPISVKNYRREQLK